MEYEIDKILESVKHQYIPTFKEIKENNTNIINKIFKDYLNYQENLENKKKSFNILEEYHYISFEDINLGDYIKYFCNKYFYDVEIKGGGFVVKKDNKYLILKTQLSLIKLVSNNHFFRKITPEELAKMKIIEELKKIDN